jgi:hypothetical protein
MDVVIKNVPEGAEANVKLMAMVAIERFIQDRDLKVADEVTSKFREDVDEIRVANDLVPKYEITKNK